MKLPLRTLGLAGAIFLALALPSCGTSSNSNTPTGPPGGNPVTAANVTANNNNTFSPALVNLLAGGSVTFSNGGGLHNVASGEFRCAQGCDGDGAGGDGTPSAAGWSFTMTFPNAATVNYVCDEHAGVGMAGSIVVQ